MTARDTATVCAISAVVGALVAALFLVPPAIICGLFFGSVGAAAACVIGASFSHAWRWYRAHSLLMKDDSYDYD